MKSLRERLAEPHFGVLFPRAIEDMSHVEREEEARECTHALLINVWQTTTQMEQVRARQKALHAALRNAEQGKIPALPEYAQLDSALAKDACPILDQYVASPPPEQPFLHAPLNGDTGFSLLKK